MQTEEILSKDQQKAYDLFQEWFFHGEKRFFVLKGYAGTGKTYLVNKIVESLIYEHFLRVAISAPTHKAVGVLSSKNRDMKRSFINDLGNSPPSSGYDFTALGGVPFHRETHFFEYSNGAKYNTTHSFFNIRETINEKGEIAFKPVPNKKRTAFLNYAELLIIDEASMINEDMMKVIEEKSIKILFVGDPFQIPPVGEAKSCVFDLEEVSSFELDKIIRQPEGSGIIPLSAKLREKPTNMFSLKNWAKGNKDVVYLERDEYEEILREKVLESKEPDDFKLLCWTNASVYKYNQQIRKIIYGEEVDEIEVGENLVTDAPVVVGDRMVMPNNFEMKVLDMEIEEKEVELLESIYPCLKLKVDTSKGYREIQILLGEVEKQYKEDVNEFKGKILSMKRKGFNVGQKWQEYYSLFDEFAQTKYNYALTVHKSQGSTYQTVMIDERNILKNRKTEEMNRIRYTALTRASEKVFLIK
jgi:exodeoxyribonuclease-5